MSRLQKLLEQMTTMEKVGQINQKLYGFHAYVKSSGGKYSPSDDFVHETEKYSGIGFLYGLHRADPWSGRNFETGLSGKDAPAVYNMLQRYVLEHSRLEIPMLVTDECPHGNQILDGFLVPVNTAAGASFNPELLEKTSRISGLQLKETGTSMALMSMLDILRDPRWGRSEECYGEDPYLASVMAKAAVKGMQSSGTLCVAKHFAAQGQTTGGVNASAALIGDRELREIHLPAAEAAVKAGAAGIMAAYNEIDGIPCHANSCLLGQILRKEMGFKGIVMADGVAIDRLDLMTGDNRASGRLALEAGVDVGLWDEAFGTLAETADTDAKVMECLNAAVLRVLEIKEKAGLFEHPFVEESDHYIQFSRQKQYTDEALEMARQSAILLKNEAHVLPIDTKKIRKIAVIGPSADDIYRQLGDYTPYVQREYCSTLLDGMRKICQGKVRVDCLQADAYEKASDYDMTILALGGSSSRFGKTAFDINGAAICEEGNQMDCGEGADSAELELPKEQVQLVRALADRNIPFVTVIIAGRPYVISEIAKYSKALLYAFYPGPFGGQALAEILTGVISPSGCLPVSIPDSAGQLPVYYNYRISYDAMKYVDRKQGVTYGFGYGLSYTEFACSGLSAEKENGEILVRAGVSNIGDMDAYDTVMLFVRRACTDHVPRVRELIGFEKLWIKAGETARAELRISGAELGDKDELLLYDGRGKIGRIGACSSWNNQRKSGIVEM